MTQHGIYDTSTEFTSDLAAKLIAGANDTDCNQDAYQSVLDSLKAAYLSALDYYRAICGIDTDAAPDKWALRKPLDPSAIQSGDMQRCERVLECDPKGRTFEAWLTVRPTDFAAQKFDRAEMQRWLDAKGMVSAYRFAGVKEENTATPAPVVAVGALGGTVTVWTTERKKAASAMRNEQRGQGIKAFTANTAAAFNVSPSRLREVLNDKPKKAPAKKTPGVWGV